MFDFVSQDIAWVFRVYLDELCVYIEDSERGIGEKSGDRVCVVVLETTNSAVRVCVS